MANTVSPNRMPRHLLLPKTADASAKADLPKTKTVTYREDLAREVVYPLLAGLTNEEVSALIQQCGGPDVNPRQIGYWRSGHERPQFDVLIIVPQFRPRLLLLWGVFIQRLAGNVEITTTICVKVAA
jgi:hypothetical protein